MNDVKSFFFVNINEPLSLPQKGSFVITQKKRNASIRYECEFKLIEQFFLDIQSPLSLSVIETIVYYSQRIYLSFTINPKISFHRQQVTTFISLSLENFYNNNHVIKRAALELFYIIALGTKAYPSKFIIYRRKHIFSGNGSIINSCTDAFEYSQCCFGNMLRIWRIKCINVAIIALYRRKRNC